MNKILMVFIIRILIELNTRYVGRINKEENFSEFLNTLFPLIEALRVILREFSLDLINNTDAENIQNKTVDLIESMLIFEDKWNLSFNAWYSGFKSNRDNKGYFNSGHPNIYYDYQIEFPNSSNMAKDIKIMNNKIKEFEIELNGILKLLKDKEEKNMYVPLWKRILMMLFMIKLKKK